MIQMRDESGNVLMVENVPHHKNFLDLFIRLESERHKRHIGRINKQTRTMHIERSEDMHILKKANAYGFNHYILKSAQTFDFIALHEDKGKRVYKIDREWMLRDGQFLFFKQQGFERQIFLTKEWLEHYEVTDKQLKEKLSAEYRLRV